MNDIVSSSWKWSWRVCKAALLEAMAGVKNLVPLALVGPRFCLRDGTVNEYGSYWGLDCGTIPTAHHTYIFFPYVLRNRPPIPLAREFLVVSFQHLLSLFCPFFSYSPDVSPDYLYLFVVPNSHISFPTTFHDVDVWLRFSLCLG